MGGNLEWWQRAVIFAHQLFKEAQFAKSMCLWYLMCVRVNVCVYETERGREGGVWKGGVEQGGVWLGELKAL